MKKLLLFLLCFLSVRLAFTQGFERGPFTNLFIGNFAVADFDGDGDTDVIGIDYAFNGPDEIFLLLNEGASPIAFQEMLLIGEVPVAGSITTADYDGDGDFDFLYATEGNNLVVWSNNGDATFEEVALNVAGTNRLEFIDAEGDGDLDIVGINRATSTLAVYLNDGEQSYSEAATLEFDAELYEFSTGDLNGDGLVDIALGFDDFFGKHLSVLINDGNLTFSEVVLAEGDFRGVSGLQIVDLNDDGSNDIAATAESDFSGWINVGNGTFERQILVDYQGTSVFGFSGLGLTDLNGDGQLDVVLGDNDGPITYYLNTSMDPLEYTQGEVGTVRPARSFAAFDMDMDGDLDLLTTNGDLWWYENKLDELSTATQSLSLVPVQVFPNPFADSFTMEGLPAGSYQVELTDTNGKVAFSEVVRQPTVRPGNLAMGVYLLKVVNLSTWEVRVSRIVKVD